MSLEKFKSFVKERPSLVEYVNKKEKTWQDFYEMFELYGERNSIWDKYIPSIISNTKTSVTDFINMIKGINLNEVQNTINSLQKGISYLGSLSRKDEDIENKSSYEPRPIHKHFDD